MSFIAENWWLIFIAAAAVALAIVFIVRFLKMPTKEQLHCVKEWLINAVAEVENIYGSNTGQLKLRAVYDLFLSRFPWLASLITFEKFSSMVDGALEDLSEILQGKVTEENINNYINKK